MPTQLDTEWIKSVTGQKKGFGRQSGGGGGTDFRFANLPVSGDCKFRLLPPDDGKVGIYIANHYGLPTDEKKEDGTPKTAYHLCVEASFPDKADMICETCEVLRRCQADGIPPDMLDNFAPSAKSYFKVQMHYPVADENGPFRRDEVIILKATEYSLTWILQQTLDADSGDFMSPTRGAVIKFSRPNANAKWERKILDSSAEGGGTLLPDVSAQEALLELSAKTDLYKIWKVPTDETLVEHKKLAANLEKHIRDTFAATNAGTAAADPVDKDPPAQTQTKPEPQAEPQAQTEPKPEDKPADPPAQTEQSGAEAQAEVVSSPAAETPAETTAPPATDTVARTQAAAASAKPSGAPDCFSNKDVYDAESMKCMTCDYDFECSSAIEKAA